MTQITSSEVQQPRKLWNNRIGPLIIHSLNNAFTQSTNAYQVHLQTGGIMGDTKKNNS